MAYFKCSPNHSKIMQSFGRQHVSNYIPKASVLYSLHPSSSKEIRFIAKWLASPSLMGCACLPLSSPAKRCPSTVSFHGNASNEQPVQGKVQEPFLRILRRCLDMQGGVKLSLRPLTANLSAKILHRGGNRSLGWVDCRIAPCIYPCPGQTRLTSLETFLLFQYLKSVTFTVQTRSNPLVQTNIGKYSWQSPCVVAW